MVGCSRLLRKRRCPSVELQGDRDGDGLMNPDEVEQLLASAQDEYPQVCFDEHVPSRMSPVRRT